MKIEEMNKQLKKIFVESFILFLCIVAVVLTGLGLWFFKVSFGVMSIYAVVALVICAIGAIKSLFLVKRLVLLKQCSLQIEAEAEKAQEVEKKPEVVEAEVVQ